MEVAQFYKKVRERAGLTDDDQVKMAIRATFAALRDRISAGGADNLAAQLPRELRDLWEAGFLHDVGRLFAGVQRMDREEFLSRVQTGAQLTSINQAESATRAVFATLREQITPGEQHAVYAQLPEDLKEMWAQGRPPEQVVEGRYDSRAIGPAQTLVQRSDEQVERAVKELLDANSMIDADAIEVEAHQGKVYLKGSVHNSAEARRAASVARHALGVTDVEVALEVEEEE